ncbi:SusC/RagA family TonB-linked outer membrane protein [Polaribacter sp. Hel1_85]|uniref:SusC/RagA family TonB-linked outer membrane protein n=1 Tax=Polaribacter sp. Hel1_85 TaxID=1250005 RepID=UPI00052DD5BE|nr:TonB-dependent receptor [Polaribacter sp. Hel1_85]KGL63857.1 TonB-dependent receptor, plug [Polaribacter sp. Hel1_85]
MRKKITLLLLLLVGFCATAQTINVKGVVKDANTGDPLPGVSIIIKGTVVGTETDFDGLYSLSKVQNGAVLVFNYLGYAIKEVVVSQQTINVSLEESAEALDEIIVVGYGSQRKELVSGAFASIDSEKITESNPARIEEALKGSAAGVQVSANSGSPGASLNIRIRGITSNGDNSPLVIVDGVNIGSDLSIIDPNDIEKMDIIKDASSAIYGVQAANGVILITTKSGKKNRPTKFSYNTYLSMQEASNQLDLMNATEYAVYVNEIEVADGNQIPYTNLGSFGVGTDWQNELFTTSPIISHTISANGGSDKITYGVSASYFAQEGIIAPEKSNFNRVTFKNNLGIDLTDKLKLNTFLLYTNIKSKGIQDTQGDQDSGRGSALYYALNASPLTSVYDGTDGTGPSRGFSYIGDNQGSEIVNPLALINNTHNQTRTNRFTGKLELEYNVLENLKATSRFNFNYADVVNRQYFPISYYGPGKVVNNVDLDGSVFDLDRNDNGSTDVFSTVYENNQNYFDFSYENFLEYKFSVGNHNFNTLLGSSIRSEQFYGAYATGFLTLSTDRDNWSNAYLFNTQSFIYDEVRDDDDNITSDTIRQNNNASTGVNEDRWYSFFGRIQYDYNSKYLFSAMLRRDASTRFGTQNRVGYFPSVSAGWVVNKEGFFKSESIDRLKLRASWGITGNDKIGSYRYLGFLQGTNGTEASYSFGDNLYYGNAIGGLSNPDLQWETNTQYNFGIDASLFEGKLDVVLDYYKKTTKDLLLIPEVSGLVGASAPGSSAPVVNAGTIENKGFDISLNFNHEFTEDFKLGLGVNVTTIKNEAKEVNNAAGFISGGRFDLAQNTSRFQTGLPIGTFYGLKTNGVYQNQAEIDALNTDTNDDGVIDDLDEPFQSGAKPGDLRFTDVDGDGIVEFGSVDDQTVLGNPIPDVTMGLNLNLNYKNFDFATSLYASIGNDVVRSYERFLAYSNRPSLYLDRWTGEGTSNTVPRATTTSTGNTLFSDFYVEDGSYLRIQNVQLGYSLPNTVLEKLKMDKLRLYIAVNNLHTFTKYSGYNPDVSNASPLGAGVDLGQYPQTRTFTTGVNISF